MEGKKIAIMQPYFFPYLGYFQLINAVDEFIIFDTPQFIRHGWIERNKILKPNGEPLYIKVPLQKHIRETKINEIYINNELDWRSKIYAQLVPYKKKASNYKSVLKLLKEIFEHDIKSIVELNYILLKEVCNYLNIETPIKIWSKMNIEIEEVHAPDEWALNICEKLNATTYYNPIGGITFFDKKKYENKNIELKFIEFEPTIYKQFETDFHSSLSIIDVMMFNSKEKINLMINEFRLK